MIDIKRRELFRNLGAAHAGLALSPVLTYAKRQKKLKTLTLTRILNGIRASATNAVIFTWVDASILAGYGVTWHERLGSVA